MIEPTIEPQCIPAAELPHPSRLYSAFLSDFKSVAEFYLHPPTAEGISQALGEVRFDRAQRAAVVEVLREQNLSFGADDAAARNLDRLRDGAVAVVTGQQVGLFGGPAFSIYKALTAIHVAAELTAGGNDAVPVFWMATEDHDLAEVDHCEFAGRGSIKRFALETPGSEGRRVGEIKLGDAITGLVSDAAAMLDGPFAAEVAGWMRESYTPEETYGTAFGKLMTRIFAGRGIIFLNPVSNELHRLSATTMLRAIEEHESLARDLVARSAELERAGFHAQVKVVPSSTLVFRIVAGQRAALRPSEDGFSAAGKHENFQDTIQSAQLHPEEFSANALLRPVIQDTLLPTVAYIAGPAECAYYAQASLVYQRLLGRAPAILPRASFTILTPHVVHLLKKYKLQMRDVFAGRKSLRTTMEAEVLPAELTALLEKSETGIKELLEQLREPLTRLDQTLVGALDTSAEKVLFQFNSLRAKAGRAQGFRTGILDTHEQEIGSLLLPNSELQERSLSILPFLASSGRELLDELSRHIKTGAGEHCFCVAK